MEWSYQIRAVSPAIIWPTNGPTSLGFVPRWRLQEVCAIAARVLTHRNSLVGLGLLKLETIPNAPGFLVLMLGMFVLFNSSQRYFIVMYRLADDQFAPNVRSLVTMVIAILIVVLVLMVMAVQGYL